MLQNYIEYDKTTRAATRSSPTETDKQLTIVSLYLAVNHKNSSLDDRDSRYNILRFRYNILRFRYNVTSFSTIVTKFSTMLRDLVRYI